MRTRSLDNVSKPERPMMQACTPAGSGGPAPKCGVKAEEAQDAQIVFLDPLLRLADEAHALRGDVGKAADIIMHHAVRPDRQRVDGEVAPLGVGLPVAPEHHARLAPEGLDIFAQRRDLDRMMTDDGREVPCSMPVGTALLPAACTRRITSSGSAVVATSISATGSPSSVLRTAPPTTRASSPSRLSRASKRAHGAFFQPRRVQRGATGAVIRRSGRRDCARCPR